MALTDQQCKQLKPEDLLTLIIEEASEVIQAATKIQRFGPHNFHPDRGRYNYLELLVEGCQLETLLRHYAAKHGERLVDMTHRQNFISNGQFEQFYPYVKEALQLQAIADGCLKGGE